MKLPAKHHAIMPYYMVVDAKKFAAFAQQVFGATVGTVVNLPETEKVIHGELHIGDSTIFFADASADGTCGPECAHDQNDEHHPSTIQLFAYVEDAEATCKTAEGQGSTIVMPAADDGTGAIMGGFVDPFGNLWWVKTPKNA